MEVMVACVDAQRETYGVESICAHVPIAPSTYWRLKAQQAAPTRRGDDSGRAPDLVTRNFTATRPNQLWVSDFTYVHTTDGFVYTALVIDVFARRIVGWRVSHAMRTDLVLDALDQRDVDAFMGDLADLLLPESVLAGLHPPQGSAHGPA